MRRARQVQLGVGFALAAQVALGVGCSCHRPPLGAEELRRRYQAAVADPADDGPFLAYLEVLPRMKGRYLMEGDLLATPDEVRQALAAVHVARAEPRPGPALPQPLPIPTPTPTPTPAGADRRPVAPLPLLAAPRLPATAPPVMAPHPPAVAPALPRRKLDLADRFPSRLRRLLPAPRGGRPMPLLKVQTEHGDTIFWGDSAQRTFVAEVDAASFAAAPRGVADLTAALEEAGRGWASLCAGCNVRFTTGGEETPGAVPFKVAYYPEDVAGALAIAFTPRSAPEDRVLWILPRFYAAGTSPAGVLRHELGHILGYLHEQVGTASVCGEVGPGEWKRVTADDPASVMHYFCGPKDDPRLVFSRLDCVGHHQVYGTGVPEPDCAGPW